MDITLPWPFVTTVIGITVGVISYFLKRTMDSLDRCAASVQKMEVAKASSEDVTKVRSDLQGRVDSLNRDIASIRQDYITKEDFFREQAKTDRKLDMIIDMLMKGGGRGGNG